VKLTGRFDLPGVADNLGHHLLLHHPLHPHLLLVPLLPLQTKITTNGSYLYRENQSRRKVWKKLLRLRTTRKSIAAMRKKQKLQKAVFIKSGIMK